MADWVAEHGYLPQAHPDGLQFRDLSPPLFGVVAGADGSCGVRNNDNESVEGLDDHLVGMLQILSCRPNGPRLTEPANDASSVGRVVRRLERKQLRVHGEGVGGRLSRQR
jgi:hypothetical protein